MSDRMTRLAERVRSWDTLTLVEVRWASLDIITAFEAEGDDEEVARERMSLVAIEDELRERGWKWEQA